MSQNKMYLTAVMILTGTLLYSEELVIHSYLNRLRFVLCCMYGVASGLCCTAQIPWTQDKLRLLIVTEEPPGSFHLILATTPPA